MIAAVRLPYFAASIEIQANPSLKTSPFIIGEQRVVAVSRKAAHCGIYPGMGVREAQALCRDLQVFPSAPLRQERQIQNILQILAAFAPQVEAEDTPLLQADARRRKNAPPPHYQIGSTHNPRCCVMWILENWPCRNRKN